MDGRNRPAEDDHNLPADGADNHRAVEHNLPHLPEADCNGDGADSHCVADHIRLGADHTEDGDGADNHPADHTADEDEADSHPRCYSCYEDDNHHAEELHSVNLRQSPQGGIHPRLDSDYD